MSAGRVSEIVQDRVGRIGTLKMIGLTGHLENGGAQAARRAFALIPRRGVHHDVVEHGATSRAQVASGTRHGPRVGRTVTMLAGRMGDTTGQNPEQEQPRDHG